MSQFAAFVFLILFSLSGIHAQNDFKGKIIDADTKEPIPYVNVGFFGKGIGTVSDADGLFNLPVDRSVLVPKDTVQLSSLGYRTVKIAVKNIEFVYNEYPEIELHPQQTELNEVVVTNKGAYEVSALVGYQNYGEKAYGYWKGDIALGRELATKIKVKKGLRKLNTLFFEVFANPSDSILIRVNLYELGKKRAVPGKNLNVSDTNILYTIHSKTKLAVIDLSPYSIYVKDDFYVSLELLKVYGNKPIGLILMASLDKGTYSLRTQSSHDKWEELSKSAMAFHLNSTYYSNEKKAAKKVLRAQKIRQKITGFVFSARRPLPNIRVTNLMTNEATFSNKKGRYQILADKNDIITFEAHGFKKKTIKLLEKRNININLIRE